MNKIHALLVLALSLFIFAACKKDDTKASPAPATPKAALYFSAKIDGADYLVQDKIDGYASGSGAGGGGDNSTGLYAQEQSLMLINMTTQHGSGVTFMKNFTDQPKDCAQMEEMIKMGVHPYGKTDRSNTAAVNGVVVLHVDAQGKYWASDLGTGDQTGSTFEVVEHIKNNDGFSERITKALFSCKLYDGQGNSKTLTNGEIRSRSVQCGHL